MLTTVQSSNPTLHPSLSNGGQSAAGTSGGRQRLTIGLVVLLIISGVTLGVLFAKGVITISTTSAPTSGATVSSQVVGVSNPVRRRRLTAGDEGWGNADGGNLVHLEYYFIAFAICENLETSGTAFTNAEGCITLYDVSEQSFLGLVDDYDTFGVDEALVSDNYLDLMDSDDLAFLTSNTTITRPGSYQYAVVTWYKPVKVEAEVPLSNDETLYTKQGDLNDAGTQMVSPTPLNVAPAELSTILLNNGGTFGRFQSPFVITQDDIDQRQNYSLVLAFNPDGIVQGSAMQSNAALVDDDWRAIWAPFLSIAPVPFRSNETVQRETYTLIVNANATIMAASNFHIRLELYFINEDPDQAIFAVDGATLYTPTTTANLNGFPRVVTMDKDTDDAYTFFDWNQTAIVSHFHRLADQSATGWALVDCRTLYLCHQDAVTTSYNVTYQLDISTLVA